MLEPEASDVGRQLVGKDEQEAELVLTSVMGVKSPNTVLKRANALLLYYRWNSVNGYFPMVPFNEEDIWRYVQEQTGRSSSASRSQSLIQGLRFAHFVMGFSWRTVLCQFQEDIRAGSDTTVFEGTGEAGRGH